MVPLAVLLSDYAGGIFSFIRHISASGKALLFYRDNERAQPLVPTPWEDRRRIRVEPLP